MEFFDRVNLIGRFFVGLYFIIQGLSSAFATYTCDMAFWWAFVVYFLAFWSLVGGLMLILGIKPRATAGVLGIVLIFIMVLDGIYMASVHDYSQHIYQAYPAVGTLGKISLWASSQLHVWIGKVGVLGALLFIAGTRMIPYGLMIRSEDSMRQKYGGENA